MRHELSPTLRSFFLGVLVLFSGLVFGQRVNPYHSGSYYPGLLDTRDLAYPDAGISLIDYNYWVSSVGYYDHDGNQVDFKQSSITAAVPGLMNVTPNMSVYFNAPVLFYSSKFKLLGGARYLASVSLPFVNYQSEFAFSTADTTFYMDSENKGFGDMALMPFGLSWTFQDHLDVSFLYTLYIPTGRYELGGSDNLGQGFWTNQFQIPVYLYAFQKATAFAIIPTIELNTKIRDADVRVGNRLSLEYGVSQYITNWLEIDMMNAHNWQISDDQGSDAWWLNTSIDTKDFKNIGSVGLSVWPIGDWLNLRFRYSFEYGVKQRFRNNIWQFSILFNTKLLSDNPPWKEL